MSENIAFYTSPSSMWPLFPEDSSGKLEGLVIDLLEKATKLSGAMNPITRAAIADFLRPMNSYYSNLIEGHDTHPLDINRALKNDYSKDKAKRDLQKEAYAHINVHKDISGEFREGQPGPIPSSSGYLRLIHKKFYDYLPEDFRFVKTKEGDIKEVIPGEFRTSEVEVGRHIAPYSENLTGFMEKFEEFYNPDANDNKAKTRRIISIAASHHRLAWIHPFLDGNGRVVRLFSDACFMLENIHSSGLWSISRGLARSNEEYKTRLANADLERYIPKPDRFSKIENLTVRDNLSYEAFSHRKPIYDRNNDYDGRGNLSNKFLVEFCEYFLKTAIDQVDFMSRVIDSENMLNRISGFVDLMALRGKMKPEAKYILTDVFLKGKISKAEAMRITQTSDKTLKLMTDDLIKMDLLEAKKEGINMMYYVKYPITFSPLLFPGLYPADKEVDMANNI